ncbi:P-loop containing nucleoside triphosphate hydrolase protein [Aspergillus pseudoustus]|uniref:P-loop containing nucleoside triphosphate hydrolase protein n=1 Tax=Aspergillus pseudoustus TaxID=1810923 RepID=A0ABR4JQ76_9EURO
MATGIRNYLHILLRSPLLNFTTSKHVPTLAAGVLCASVASFTLPLFSFLLGGIFNQFTLFGVGQITGQVLIQQVSSYAILLLGLGTLGWFWNGIYFILFVAFGELQAANARDSLFNGLLKKNQRFFEEQEEGTRTFLGCVQIQIQELQIATSQSLGLTIEYLFRTLVSLGVAFYTSWNLALVILAGIPVVSLIVPYLAPKINTNIEAQQNELKSASKVVNNAVVAIDTVKCLNGQAIEGDRFSSVVDRSASFFLRQAHFNALQISTMRFMMFGMFVQGFWYGSSLVHSGKLSAGEVLRTFWACSTAAQSLEALMPHLVILEKGKFAATALRRTLHDGDKALPVVEMQGAQYPGLCDGELVVTSLSFTYPSQPDRPSLKSCNFTFPAGTTTFVIGKSGSGKSTLAQLLTRFYRPTSGEILIDGNHIQTLSTTWIRNNITCVEQRSILFNESIFKNIAFGRHDHDEVQKDDAVEPIDLAMLASTIEKLPNGIDTLVGEGGNALSGGQRQRVAIARARLRDPPILILDEPTSALDGSNRIHVMNAIRKWREDKTTIIITHDMSHIRDGDFAYVLEEGSVVQAGYKAELKLEPGLHRFFQEDHQTPKTGDPECLNKSEPDVDTSDVSSVCSEDTFADIPLKGLDMHNPIPNARPRTSPMHGDLEELKEISLQKDPLALETEILLEPLKPKTPREVRFEGPSSSKIFKRRLEKMRRRVTKPSKHNGPSAPTAIVQNPIRKAMQSILPSLSYKHRLLLFVGVLCTLVHAAATPIFSYLLSRLLLTFYSHTNDNMRWALAVLGVAIGDGSVNYLMFYLLDICGQVWVDNLRKVAFERILDQDQVWFEDERNNPGELSTCLHESGEEVRNLLTRFSGYILIAVSVTLVAVIWSLVMSWKLTLVALACGPVIYAITRGFETTSGIWDRRCTVARVKASEVFVETFSEIRTVRGLTLEDHFHQKHLRAASMCLAMGLRKAIYTGLLFGLIESMILFVSALIFYYGAALVRYGDFTVDEILSVFSVLLFSIAYASTVMTWIPQINTSREMARRLFRLVDLPAHTSHEHTGTHKPKAVSPIEIKNLNFHYPSRPNALVLRDISLTIPSGSCTALVGRSGSGKSTVASLLLSLYETPSPSSASSSETDVTPAISLAGMNIRDIHTPTLRSLVSIVSQTPTVFLATVQENIAYGLPPSSPLRTLLNVRAAATAAGIDDFISSLPNGYQTTIGDGGLGLSGGQAQRVVIARALVREPQVLVLDEATSALDPGSAETVRRTVRGLVDAREGLTVLIITHSREMMEIADSVVMLDEGRVVETGPFRALARRRNGKLRALIGEAYDNDDTKARANSGSSERSRNQI